MTDIHHGRRFRRRRRDRCRFPNNHRLLHRTSSFLSFIHQAQRIACPPPHIYHQADVQANRVTDKLTHIHDRIYCCRSGSAADTQAVADIVHQHAQVYTAVYGEKPPVATAASMFEKLCYENKDALSAGIIVAGWDKEQGGSVYNIPLGGGMFRQPWAIGGMLNCFCGSKVERNSAGSEGGCQGRGGRK